MKLRYLHLYSKKPIELAQFLSDVFDYVILPTEEDQQIVVQGDKWSFLVKKASAAHLFSSQGERDVEFEFKLDSIDELEDLGHKIEFHFYRSRGMSPAEFIKWERSKTESSFYLCDPEERKWRFSAEVRDQ